MKKAKRIEKRLPENYSIYRNSITGTDNTTYALVRNSGTEKRLYVSGSGAQSFEGEAKSENIKLCPLTWENAQQLMDVFDWLVPSFPSSKPSFGFGDRTGLATPGHKRSLGEHDVFPIFAQQSIREMERTGRTPQDVMNTAVWGVFEEGYREGFAADADHLKTRESIEETAAVGFNMFTCDPSEHVTPEADSMSEVELEEALRKMERGKELLEKYSGRKFTASLPGHGYEFERIFRSNEVKKAIVKYFPAVKFAVDSFDWVSEARKGEFIFEVSVDETETPTTPLEHVFVAKELTERGVDLFSLAPRFVGDIEKGIDYIGDLDRFEEQLKAHAAIARSFGDYRLSLHSGSDKFSIYPYFAEYLGEKVHVKTAGTSYLEAIRLVAEKDPDLFRRIHEFALERFDEDRATYHVETDLSEVPGPGELSDEKLPDLFDRDDPRQVFHVTYGSVLNHRKGTEYVFRDEIKNLLKEYEERHYRLLESHLGHHLDLLTQG
ncbi:tagaturonate epimerase family protein [Candidatus Bipolaricaulota bacterium]|nr:tagaturonate epimerase family protein [Candidatus Bipolaricaulota bacterium]